MTKYKEYLRSHGFTLECDYEALPCNDIKAIEPRVIADYVLINYYSTTTRLPKVLLCERSGEYSWHDGYDDEFAVKLMDSAAEYVNYLHSMGCDKSSKELDVMCSMYHTHNKVKRAFRHMRAGIMDKEVCYRWLEKFMQEHKDRWYFV